LILSLPLSLYHKAKQLFWDLQEIDPTQDARNWVRLNARECDILLRLTAQFLGGEQVVTHDLAHG
jgi:ribonucleoside-diphosphate reductase beta chain